MARNQYMLFLYKLKYAFDTEQHDGFKENLAWMGQHSDVAIITGTKDRMFPHEQGHSVLSLAGVNGNINYIDVDGAHESMACELGLGQVGIGFDWIENVAYLQHA